MAKAENFAAVFGNVAFASLAFVGGVIFAVGIDRNTTTTLPDIAELRAEIEGIVDARIQSNPEAIVASVNALMAEQQAAAAAEEDRAFASMADEITAAEGMPFHGPLDAPATLVYFFDSACGFCKRLQPDLDAVARANANDVRIVYREIPVLGPTSHVAAIHSQVVWEMYPDRWQAFHDALLGQPESPDRDVLSAIMTSTLGADGAAAVTAEYDAQGERRLLAESLVGQNLAVATQAGITGTPFVFSPETGQVMRGAAPDARDVLQAMIDASKV